MCEGEFILSYNEAIKRTIDWIEQHLQEEIHIDDVTRVSHFSRYHFHRIFQNEVGISVASYIRLRRIVHAAMKLLHTSDRILDIALTYQFESQEAFTRAFKKIYHLPPGQYRKFMKQMIVKKEELHMHEEINGWFISGSHPHFYKSGIDREQVHQGNASAYLESLTVDENDQFATLMQQVNADKYKGKRIKLSGFIKSENVATFSGLWMRVDSASEDLLQFDNMHDRPITGTNNWNHYAIILDIPENSATISYGILLTGAGKVWLDGLKFEEVDNNVPTTHLEINVVLLDEPTNLNFEE